MQSSHPVKAGDHVFLVDGSSFVFRAYFQSIRQDPKYNFRSDRLPTGAVRIFCTKILQFVREGAIGIKPTHLAIIFDKSENSFRKALYPLYKANRSDPPEDLVRLGLGPGAGVGGSPRLPHEVERVHFLVYSRRQGQHLLGNRPRQVSRPGGHGQRQGNDDS